MTLKEICVSKAICITDRVGYAQGGGRDALHPCGHRSKVIKDLIKDLSSWRCILIMWF